jgi:hypothetical protein
LDLKPDNIIVDFENNPIFIDIDSMGVDEYKIDNEDYRSINTRTIPNYEEKFKKLNRKEMDKFMLLAAFINSLSNERYISLSKKIFDSNLDLLTKKKLLEFLRENKKIDSDEVIEILKEEQNIRKNR